jgi:hypothetical protein
MATAPPLVAPWSTASCAGWPASSAPGPEAPTGPSGSSPWKPPPGGTIMTFLRDVRFRSSFVPIEALIRNAARLAAADGHSDSCAARPALPSPVSATRSIPSSHPARWNGSPDPATRRIASEPLAVARPLGEISPEVGKDVPPAGHAPPARARGRSPDLDSLWKPANPGRSTATPPRLDLAPLRKAMGATVRSTAVG